MTERAPPRQRQINPIAGWMLQMLNMLKAQMPVADFGESWTGSRHREGKCARHYQNKVARNRRRNKIARASRRGKYLT